MNPPETPRKRRANRAVITSPYFSQKTTGRRVKLELDFPVSPSKVHGHMKRPDFMTFHKKLPLGPEINMEEKPTGFLSQADIAWYSAEFAKLDDPLYAFKLRNSVYLKYKLYCAKPILIQEKVACDPWKLLIAVILLNKTAGKLSIPIFWRIQELWPTPEALSSANENDLRILIQPLGLHNIRAKRLIKLSAQYLSDPPHPDKLYTSRAYFIHVQVHAQTHKAKAVIRNQYPPTPISHFPGVGAYALDSYRIFCTPGDEWKQVLPDDKELICYLKWKWAFYEDCRWEPHRGPVAPIDEDYLESLPNILAQ